MLLVQSSCWYCFPEWFLAAHLASRSSVSPWLCLAASGSECQSQHHLSELVYWRLWSLAGVKTQSLMLHITVSLNWVTVLAYLHLATLSPSSYSSAYGSGCSSPSKAQLARHRGSTSTHYRRNSQFHSCVKLYHGDYLFLLCSDQVSSSGSCSYFSLATVQLWGGSGMAVDDHHLQCQHESQPPRK